MADNFWAELPKPFFVLAPMEDVTDVVFRHVVREAGARMSFLRSSRIRIVIVIRMVSRVCGGGWFLGRMSSQSWRIFGGISLNFSVR